MTATSAIGCTSIVVDPLPISGLILAGGQGRRMGGRDKGLINYRGKPLIDWVVERVLPQVGELMISANRNLEEYARRSCQVLPDETPDFRGPLAGMLAGLQAAQHQWLLVVPCDVPYLPQDLARCLFEQAAYRDAVYARDDERSHPAILLLNKTCLSRLRDYLEEGGSSVKGFLAGLNTMTVHFSNPAAFKNLNEAEQLEN